MKIKDTEISVIKGDITELEIETIVNAANNEFLMGGGVAGAIKKKGGRIIEDEAIKLGPVEVGESVITGAGLLKAKYIIHASTMAMPACRQAGAFETDEDKIHRATRTALECAQKHKITEIAFPALGCGVGGFPYDSCARIMVQEVWRSLRETKTPTLKKIVFVLYKDNDYQVFSKTLNGYLDHLINVLCQGPFVTVDGIIEYKDGIVLIERSNPPFGWAIPGGFLDYGETVEETAVREVKEETGLDFYDFKLLKVCSNPKRDPRFQTVTIVFYGKGKGILKADSDAKNIGVFNQGSLPQKMAFDHRQIVEEYFKERVK